MRSYSEFQMSLSIDNKTGAATAYLLGAESDGRWSWLADAEFGPFDTVLDVTAWLVRKVVANGGHLLR